MASLNRCSFIDAFPALQHMKKIFIGVDGAFILS
jgi:hypothetical protein